VKARVLKGGHGVPEDKIRSRYKKSLQMLKRLVALSDECLVVDNTDLPEVIYKKGTDGEVYLSNDFWTESDIRGLIEASEPPLTILNLDQFRRSPNRGAGASRPKRNYTSPQGEIYFKFDLTNNENCAELFAYDLAKQLGIDVALTRLAQSGSVFGVASYDIGEYEEPSDDISYSVKDFIGLDGFVNMCLFDYLIMNEDRHAGNWGIIDGRVASLFDHNYSFGGPDVIDDVYNFMYHVTTPFYVEDENKQRHDTILLYFVKYHAGIVSEFMRRLSEVSQVSNDLWSYHIPDSYARLNEVLSKRIDYMVRKVGEYSAKQIDDNDF